MTTQKKPLSEETELNETSRGFTAEELLKHLPLHANRHLAMRVFLDSMCDDNEQKMKERMSKRYGEKWSENTETSAKSVMMHFKLREAEKSHKAIFEIQECLEQLSNEMRETLKELSGTSLEAKHKILAASIKMCRKLQELQETFKKLDEVHQFNELLKNELSREKRELSEVLASPFTTQSSQTIENLYNSIHDLQQLCL